MITRIVLITLLAAGLAACAGESGSSNGTSVVAGFYPLAFAAEEIGGDGVEVTNLTPAGAEPHDLELTPREVEEILDADLVFYVGEGFQPAVEEAAAESNGETIDVLEGLELRDGDPHVWLDPVLFGEVAERIGVALGDEISPRRLHTRLNDLDDAYRVGLADCERHELVTTHDAFGYLADRYGLEVIPIAGLSPEAEPSPQDLEAVVDLVEARGVTTVFTETLLSPEVGETVAREAGAMTAVLNPLEGLAEDELARGEDYFSVMEANLEALRQGLGCR
ncbi:MAG TPA: metal ABC transporter substrate-binding protein [Gaiellaceae bacterium]|nr:metal ABC transporter substrate-binding protein [Gaiellaceae bacterium]